MRPLHLVVVLETIALTVVAVLWILRPAESAPAVVGSGSGPPSGAPTGVSPAEGLASGSADGAPGDERASRVVVPADDDARTARVLVRGRVRADDGGELPGDIGVSFRRVGDTRRATCVGTHYAVPNLRPGPWEVEFRADGFVPGSQEVELSADPVQTLDLELTRAWRLDLFVEGRDGVDLEAALSGLGIHVAFRAIATDQPLVGDSVALGASGLRLAGVGRFDVKGDSSSRRSEHGEAGVFWLEHPPPVQVALLLHHTVVGRQAVAAGQRSVRFVVDPEDLRARLCRVSLRVLDGVTGRPIPDEARVSLSSAGVSGATRVEREGERLVLPAVIPGLAMLHLGAGRDRERRQHKVMVPVGGDLDLGDFVLGAATVLHGRMLDADGVPSGGEVRWGVVPVEDEGHGVVPNARTVADGDGRFAIHGLGPHRYVVEATGSDGSIGYAVLDAAPATEDRPGEVALGPSAKISVDPGPPAGEAWRLRVRDRDGVTVREQWLSGRSRRDTLRVGLGNWQVDVATQNGAVLLQRDLRLTAGAHEILEVAR